MKLSIKSPIAKQIENFFIEILNRHPSKTDLESYLDMLESGKIHLADIPNLMKISNEYKILKHLQEIKEGPIKTVDGLLMYLKINDKSVSYPLSINRIWEPFETSLLKKYLGENTNFVDIGANIGYYTLLAASISNRGRTVAFEPEKENFKVLDKNVRANKLTNITLSDYAISDKDGFANFYVSEENSSGDNRFFGDNFRDIPQRYRHIKVKCISLDSFLIKDGMIPDIVKMDIQGGEMLALKGMIKTLENSNRLILFSEFWPKGIMINGGSPYNFLESLNNYGFEIYQICSEKNKLAKKSMDQLVKEHLSDSEPELQTDIVCFKNVKTPSDLL